MGRTGHVASSKYCISNSNKSQARSRYKRQNVGQAEFKSKSTPAGDACLLLLRRVGSQRVTSGALQAGSLPVHAKPRLGGAIQRADVVWCVE